MKNKGLSAILAFMLVGGGFLFASTSAAPGDSPNDPIVLTSPGDAPEGAVTSGPVTNPDTCETTQTWVLTVPATDATSHEEFRYKRDVPAVQEQAHNEWGVEQRTRTDQQVPDYQTQYHFSKYTHTKTRTLGPDLWWNFSPNNTHTTFHGPALWPTDSRGTWQGPHENGGPQQDEFGTFANGNPDNGGNWFHRDHGEWGPWSDFGPWTQWTPITHESWQDSTDPLGSPEFHGQGQDGDVQWYREWQARFDDQTRQVEVGSHIVFSDWTAWTTLSDHLTAEPTLAENTTLHEYRLIGPVRVVDVEAVDGYALYYVLGGEPSLNVGDATWLLASQAPSEGWSVFDERSVSDENGTPETVTYYAWSDNATCEVPPPPPPVPPTPPVPPKPPVPPVPPVTPPTTIDAGL